MHEIESLLATWREDFERKYNREPSSIEEDEARKRISKQLELEKLRNAQDSGTEVYSQRNRENNYQPSAQAQKKHWPLIVVLVVLLCVLAVGAFMLGATKSDHPSTTDKTAKNRVSKKVSSESKKETVKTSESSSSVASSSSTIDTKNLTNDQAIAWIVKHASSNPDYGNGEDGNTWHVTYQGKGSTSFEGSIADVETDPDSNAACYEADYYSDQDKNAGMDGYLAETNRFQYRINSEGYLQCGSYNNSNGIYTWTTVATTYDA